jgi:hypothetical protein
MLADNASGDTGRSLERRAPEAREASTCDLCLRQRITPGVPGANEMALLVELDLFGEVPVIDRQPDHVGVSARLCESTHARGYAARRRCRRASGARAGEAIDSQLDPLDASHRRRTRVDS